MMLWQLTLYFLLLLSDAGFNNRPSLYTYIPKYHDSAITIWSEINATCNLPGRNRGEVTCDRCAITVDGNSGVCLIGKYFNQFAIHVILYDFVSRNTCIVQRINA